MHRKTVYTLAGLMILALLLAACGGSAATPAPAADDNGGGSTATTAPADSPSGVDRSPPPDDVEDYGLAPDSYRLVLEGAYLADTDEDGVPGAATFEAGPFGDNNTGSLQLELTADGRFPDEADSDLSTPVTITFALAGALSPGEYDIFADNRTDAALETGMGNFNENRAGTLTLDWINRGYITGSFELSGDNTDGETLTVSGAFHAIPFVLQPEINIVVSGALQEIIEGGGTSIMGTEYSMIFWGVNLRVNITFESMPEAGEYDVTAADLPFTLDFSQVEVEDFSGTITFDDDPQWLNGSVDLSITSEAGDSTLRGPFNYFPRVAFSE